MHGAPGDGKPLSQRPARQFAVGLEQQQRGKQSFGFDLFTYETSVIMTGGVIYQGPHWGRYGNASVALFRGVHRGF